MKNQAKNTVISGDYSTSLNWRVIDEVPDGSKCLDVGCWSGNLGEVLIKKKSCTVDGIDMNIKALKEAGKKGYKKTFLINLNNDAFSLDGLRKDYEVIIFADVLEHLINPKKILELLRNNLSPTGIIIISLPNVAFVLNRLLLLMGHWDYREFGTLDKTHLKFFTIQTISRLVEDCKFELVKVTPYNQFGALGKFIPTPKFFPTLFAYQTLLVAKLKK